MLSDETRQKELLIEDEEEDFLDEGEQKFYTSLTYYPVTEATRVQSTSKLNSFFSRFRVSIFDFS